MKITLLADDAIRLDPVPGPMTIEAPTAEMVYSPFHMLASALATCVFSVIESWASHAKLRLDDLAIEVRWTFADDPHRVGDIAISFDWPSLPANRVAAARRVAELCTVHATLHHPPHISVEPKNAKQAVIPSERSEPGVIPSERSESRDLSTQPQAHAPEGTSA